MSEEISKINEKIEVDATDNGITGYGEYTSIILQQAKHNNLMELKISGEVPVASKFKSLQSILDEYQESDWSAIERIYKEATVEASKYIKEAIKLFEKNINLAVKSIESDLKKL